MRNFVFSTPRDFWLVGMVALLAAIFAAPLLAKPGDLDSTYGDGTGKVLVSIAGMLEHESISLLQPDGKLLIGGICRPTSALGPDRTCIARFLPSGNIDTSFGTAGSFVGASTACVGGGALALLPSGELLFGGIISQTIDGVTRSPFCVSRLTADGVFDNSFGQSGIATIYIPGTYNPLNAPITLSRLPDSRLILSGRCTLFFPYAGEYKICLTRLLANGSVDVTFGDNGSRILNYATKLDYLSTVTITSTTMFFAGFCSATFASGSEIMCVTATNLDGAIETGYGIAGRVSVLPAAFISSQASDLLALADGSALVAGACVNAIGRRGCLVKLQASGAIDTTFGSGGILFDWSPFAMTGFGQALFSQDGENIILSGRCGESLAINSPCLWRIAKDGVPDAQFGMSGVVTINFPPTVKTFGRYGTHQQANGKIVNAVSCVYANGDEDFCLARLLDKQGYFDLDSDNQTRPETDALLFLRHLLGYRDTTLTTGAIGTYADRTAGADIATYLSTPNPTYPNCSASIVGAPNGPSAMLDGIVLLRVMMGLTDEAVTGGIAFPQGTARTSWDAIRTHLNTNCGMALS